MIIIIYNTYKYDSSVVNILSFAVSKGPLSLMIITRTIIATMIVITDVINNLTFYGQVCRKERDIITETKDVTQLNSCRHE